MPETTIGSILAESCHDMYEQMEIEQKVAIANKTDKQSGIPGMVTTFVKDIKPLVGSLRLSLAARLQDTDCLGLRVAERDHFDDVSFDDYDELSLTISLNASEKLLAEVRNVFDRNHSEVMLITDMKWLIKRTESTYLDFGDRLGLPSRCGSFSQSDYRFPAGVTPTEQQRKAVDTILNNKLSYVWGAPGTGKTQLVLATAIMAYMRKGKHVMVIAPTNNAVEQVLRGLMKALEKDPEAERYLDVRKDVLRLGMATSGFYNDFPNLCEKKNTTGEIKKHKDKISELKKLRQELEIQSLKKEFDSLEELLIKKEQAGFFKRSTYKKQINSKLDDIRASLSSYPEYSNLMISTDADNILSNIDKIRNRLFNRDIPMLQLDEYRGLSEKDIDTLIKLHNDEIKELENYQCAAKMKTAKIIAMTPHIFMGYRKNLLGDGLAKSIDHIFIDEVGYSNLIQTLPVFMCGAPVTMLGDHKQLAPVCELDDSKMTKWYDREDRYMHDSYLWAVSALYSESILRGRFEDVAEAFFEGRDPEFRNGSETALASLTVSHRFGQNLAEVLDRCVYRNGISGASGDNLTITVIDTSCEVENKVNAAEAAAIREYVDRNHLRSGDFAILTPYRDQVAAIRKVLPNHREDIMTIHKSQGREWDTVIISVRDNGTGQTSRTRFTSTTRTSDGLRVMNTAISRAKKNLVIVCDCDFWSNSKDDDELITAMLNNSETTYIRSE